MEGSTEYVARTGVLVLPPGEGEKTWRVLEVEADVSSEDLAAGSEAGAFSTPTGALHAAFDVLTIVGEGRIPAMHEHIQESVREFVRTLEARGFDRASAVKILLDMLDRRAIEPPKRIGSRHKH